MPTNHQTILEKNNSNQPNQWEVKVAVMSDIPALNKLIEQSARGLSQGFYTPNETESLIEHVFGVDSELVTDETYYKIEQDGQVIICGGYSKRKTLYGADHCEQRESGYLNPETDAAKIRAFFTHPDWARKGLAQALITHCEKQALLAGFKQIELMATLPGVPFYLKNGYVYQKDVVLNLPDGVDVTCQWMIKDL